MLQPGRSNWTAEVVKEKQGWGHRMGWLNLAEQRQEVLVKLHHEVVVLNVYSQWTL